MLFYDTALLLPAPTLGPLANLRMEQTAADFRNTFRWNCDLRDSRKLKHGEVLLRNFWFRLSLVIFGAAFCIASSGGPACCVASNAPLEFSIG
jgi:hypothetical protein